MNFFLTPVFLLTFYISNSQSYYLGPKPAMFDTFTSRFSITWAGYAYDSLRFNDPNLSEILVDKMEKSEIKTAYPLWHPPLYTDEIVYTNKEENHQMFYHCPHGNNIYDSLGNLIDSTCPQDRFIDYRTHNFLWLAQTLYVEDGELKSYIPWVAPAFSAVLSTREFLFIDAYFRTCFNFKDNFIAGASDKTIYLGETKKRLVFDSTLEAETIKKTYGRNLLQSLWVQILSGKNEVYDIGTKARIMPGELNFFILSSKPNTTFPFDSLGNQIAARNINPNPIPYYITHVEIVQQWYYNHTKNIVTCMIPEMYLYAGRDDNNVPVKADRPVLKIVFK